MVNPNMTFSVTKGPGGFHHVSIPQEVVDRLKGEKRIILRMSGHQESPGQQPGSDHPKTPTHKIHSAIQRRNDFGYYIYIGAGNLKKLDLEAGMEFEAKIEVDTSEYQFEMPEEFEEVLQIDPEAEEIFKRLTPGNQRSLIYLVSKVKSIDLRIEKALKIADGLKRGITSSREILKS